MCSFYIRKECNGITNKIICYLRPDLQKDKMSVDGCRGNLVHTEGKNPPQNFPTIFFQLLPLNYIASCICVTLKCERLQ